MAEEEAGGDSASGAGGARRIVTRVAKRRPKCCTGALWFGPSTDVKYKGLPIGEGFVYKSPKFIKVDHAGVFAVHRCGALGALCVALLPLYFNDAWAATETPGGTVNAWVGPGTMETSPMTAADTAYCNDEQYSYSASGFRIDATECRALMAAELTRKTPTSVFYTSAFVETVLKGWPCAEDVANGTRRQACVAGGGDYFGRRNGLCGCQTQAVVYPLALEEMILGFDHSFDTEDDGWFGSSALGKYARNLSQTVSGAAALAGAEAMWSDVRFANGTRRRFEAGETIELPLSEWLAAANVSLDTPNERVRADGSSGGRPPRRTTGVSLRVDVVYSNIDEETGRAVIGKRSVHATINVSAAASTWTQDGQDSNWIVLPRRPRSTPSEMHLVERKRMGVLVQFHVSGKIFKFSLPVVVQVVVSAVVMIGAAKLLADAVAFYLLPNGQSTVLRNKRQEMVSKRSEFAEIGMKAALAARFYRSFDPDNNGSIEPVDIVRAFAQVVRSDGEPWVSWEQAHAIAHMILDDADTDDGKLGGQYGLSYEEFMTCMEGDAINFASYLSNLSPPKGATDADECRKAFEEERATLPPVTRPGARDPGAVPRLPAKKLELSDEEKQARLGRKGSLELHLHSASGLKPSDDGWTADPYVVSTLGKREVKSAFIEKCLDPVWGECLKFERMPLEKALSKRKLRLKLMDYDEGFMETDDLLGKLSVDIGSLADHESLAFEEAVKPQGTIVFQLRWVDSGATQKV